MTNGQLELGLNGAKLALPLGRRERRITRAKWWFARMRQIVDRAMDWEAAGNPRPEQIWLPGAQHQSRI
jgi:hypothetical protein